MEVSIIVCVLLLIGHSNFGHARLYPGLFRDESEKVTRAEVENIVNKKINDLLLNQSQTKPQVIIQNIRGRKDPDADNGKKINVQAVEGRSGLGYPNAGIDSLLEQSQGKQKSQLAVQNGDSNDNLDVSKTQSEDNQKPEVVMSNVLRSSEPLYLNNDINALLLEPNDTLLAQLQGSQKSQVVVQNVVGRSGLNNSNNDIDSLLAQSQGTQQSQVATQNVLGSSGLFYPNNDINALLAQSHGSQKSQVAAKNILGSSGLLYPNNDTNALLAQPQGSQKSQVATQNVRGRSGLLYPNNDINALLAQSHGSQKSQVATQNVLGSRGLLYPKNDIDALLLQLQGNQKSQIAGALINPYNNLDALLNQRQFSQNSQGAVQNLQDGRNPHTHAYDILVPVLKPNIKNPRWPVVTNLSPKDLLHEVIIRNINGVITPAISNQNPGLKLIPIYKIEQFREFLFKYILETLIHKDLKYVIYNARTEAEKARANMLIHNYRMIIYAFTEFLHKPNLLAGYIQTIRLIAQNRPAGSIDNHQRIIDEVEIEKEIDENISLDDTETVEEVDNAGPLPISIVPSNQPEYEIIEECCSDTDMEVEKEVEEQVDEDVKELVNIKEDINYQLFCQPLNSNEIVELVQIVVNRFVVELITTLDVQVGAAVSAANIAVAETLHNQNVYAHKRCNNDLPNRLPNL